MLEYIIGGAATGAMYKFNLGLRGLAAGAIVGGALGTVGGAISLLILRSTGMTMEEVRYWQYKWRSSRDDAINEGWKTQFKGTERSDALMDYHDSKPEIGLDKLDIKILEQEEEKTQAKAPDVKSEKK